MERKKVKLREYIEEEKINIAILARKAGIPYATAKHAVEGGNITLKNAYKLQLATKGKCKLLDMLPEEEIKEENLPAIDPQ